MVYSVVLVGLGKMGGEYARTIVAHPKLEIIGAVSRSPDRTREFAQKYGISGVYTSISEAYRVTRADAVIISVPPEAVSQLLMEAWAYPWKCLTEKPAGNSLAESAGLLAEQHKAKQKPSVALNRRFYSHVAEIRSQLASHRGKKFILSRDQYLVSKTPAVRETQLFEKAIHVVDLFSFLLSDHHVRVSSACSRLGEVGIVLSSRIEFSEGSNVEYYTALNIPGRWSISVFSEHTNWLLEPLEDGWISNLANPQPQRMKKGDMDVRFKPGIFAMLDELVIELEGHDSLLPSIEDSHRSMTLLSDVFSSLRICA